MARAGQPARRGDEVANREALENEHARHRAEWEEKDKARRERDSLRTAAIKDRTEPGDGEVRSL